MKLQAFLAILASSVNVEIRKNNNGKIETVATRFNDLSKYMNCEIMLIDVFNDNVEIEVK